MSATHEWTLPERSFSQQLVREIRRSPRMLISVLLHGLLAVLLSGLGGSRAMTDMRPPLASHLALRPVAKALPDDGADEVPQIAEQDTICRPPNREFSEHPLELQPTPAPGARVSACATSMSTYGKRRRRLRWLNRGPLAVANRAALHWLERQQRASGNWQVRGVSGSKNHQDVQVTSLVLLAYLAVGQTHRDGLFKATVRRGLMWLRSRKGDRGDFHPPGAADFIIVQSLATLTMVDAYGLTRSGLWRHPAQQGLDSLVAGLVAQNRRGSAALRESEAATLAWLHWVLKAASECGLDVPGAALARACESVRRLERLSRVELDEGAAQLITALGILAREGGRTHDLEESATALRQALPVSRTLKAGDPMVWLTSSRALAQISHSKPCSWNTRLSNLVRSRQRVVTPEIGSWDPRIETGLLSHRVPWTAFMVLCMQGWFR